MLGLGPLPWTLVTEPHGPRPAGLLSALSRQLPSSTGTVSLVGPRPLPSRAMLQFETSTEEVRLEANY